MWIKYLLKNDGNYTIVIKHHPIREEVVIGGSSYCYSFIKKIIKEYFFEIIKFKDLKNEHSNRGKVKYSFKLSDEAMEEIRNKIFETEGYILEEVRTHGKVI